MAQRLLPLDLDRQRILDIGCGQRARFLLRCRFPHRFGLDACFPAAARSTLTAAGLTLIEHDLSVGMAMPFADQAFDAVTMLAVIEHLEPMAGAMCVGEAHRLLRPGGVLVLTTPGEWTGGLLKALAAARLVSRSEVRSHETNYSPSDLKRMLLNAGFGEDQLRVGRFQLGVNVYAVARKCSDRL